MCFLPLPETKLLVYTREWMIGRPSIVLYPVDCLVKLAFLDFRCLFQGWQTWDTFRLLTYIYISYTLSHKMASKGVIPSFRGMLPVAPYRRFFPAVENRRLRSMESSEALAGKGKGLGGT